MAKKLSTVEIGEFLKKTAGWEVTESGGAGAVLRKTYALKNFASALRFVNRVGEAAEAMDHHPDIFLHDYKVVTFTLTTHSEGALTRLDFDLAAKIENAFQELQNLTGLG